MNWAMYKLIALWLSNTIEVEFCVEVLKDALLRYGPLKISSTDQGSQFITDDFTQVSKNAKVEVATDRRVFWVNNCMVEWLGRSWKYKCVNNEAF